VRRPRPSATRRPCETPRLSACRCLCGIQPTSATRMIFAIRLTCVTRPTFAMLPCSPRPPCAIRRPSAFPSSSARRPSCALRWFPFVRPVLALRLLSRATRLATSRVEAITLPEVDACDAGGAASRSDSGVTWRAFHWPRRSYGRRWPLLRRCARRASHRKVRVCRVSVEAIRWRRRRRSPRRHACRRRGRSARCRIRGSQSSSEMWTAVT
jgi:hypothetical protein